MSKLSPFTTICHWLRSMRTLSCASRRLWDAANQPRTQRARLARICKVKGLSHNASFYFKCCDSSFLLHARLSLTSCTRKRPDTIKQVRCEIDAVGFVLSNVFNPKHTSLSEATKQTGLLRARIVKPEWDTVMTSSHLRGKDQEWQRRLRLERFMMEAELLW